MKRRLAAILAADVVGYSRLMGLDEADTLARLKSLHRDLVRPNITGRGGRIVKLMGDGLLAEFPSALEAVQCAVDIQRAMPEREAEQPKERRIALRIGVNLGDIVIEGADIFGDGVNVAARLETLAQPGCICVSSTVKDQVRGTLRQEFRDLGEVEVKNIERPIHVFGWPESTRLPPGSARPRTDRSGKPSIAILPFSNMSSMPGQEAFVDGLTEDIITGLSHMRWYDVKARNSTLAFKGTAADVCEIGRALNVGYVLEGSVRKGETSLRITAKLIDARNGNQIWADRFDRDIGDDFAIQDEIAQRVASILGERIWQDVSKHIGSKRPADYTAYDYAYAAINRLHRLEPPDVVTAKDYFLKALELNPDLPTCHIGLGFCYLVGALYLGSADDDAIDKAHEQGLKLLELAPDDAQTYRLLSRTYWAKGMHAEAWQSVQRALRLNPNDGDIIANRGIYHLFMGEFDEAHEWIDKVLAVHNETPYTTDIMHHWKAMASFGAGDYKESLNQLVQISGLSFLKNLFLAACQAELGNREQAEANLRSAMTIRPDLSLSTLGFWRLFHRDADRQHFRCALQKAGLPD